MWWSKLRESLNLPTSIEQKNAGWLSVTEVLDFFIPKALLDWYLKTGKANAKKIGTIAMKIGSRVDDLIQEDITNGAYKLSKNDGIEVRNCMKAWEQFKQDYQPDIKRCQVEVMDEEKKVIGHIDLIWNGVVDVKCASSIKANYWLQTAKYRNMGNIEGGIHILRLDKNLAIYEFKSKGEEEANYLAKVFDGLLQAHRYYNKQLEKNA